jgi:hypothetical protein
MKAYKITDKEGKCLGYSFKVGNTYKHEGAVKCCESGFHACENPMDCQGYHGIYDGRFFVVDCRGIIDKTKDKLACSEIEIIRELTLKEYISECFDYTFKMVNSNDIDSGGNARLASSGDGARLASSGDGAVVAGIGYCNKVSVADYDSWIIIVNWFNGKAKGVFSKKPGQKIKGTVLKVDTWYWFENGQLKSEPIK